MVEALPEAERDWAVSNSFSGFQVEEAWIALGVKMHTNVGNFDRDYLAAIQEEWVTKDYIADLCLELVGGE